MSYKPTEDSELNLYEATLMTTDSSIENISCLETLNVTSLFATELSSQKLDDLLDNPSQLVNTTEIKCGNTEPTPIGPNRINIVDKVPLQAASWYHDKSVSISLYDLLAETNRKNVPPCYKELSTLLPCVPVDSIARVKSGDTSESNVSEQNCYTERWNERYEDLVDFQRKYKHCLVPLHWPSNPSLGHWVKRQRYQYSLKLNGTHSTLTKDREEALQKLGFVWDSHAALWEERWNELQCFKERHGHCHVPSRYRENPKLSIWVKCQRRQFKLLTSGEKSNMTFDRINKLRGLGFVFEPRKRRT